MTMMHSAVSWRRSVKVYLLPLLFGCFLPRLADAFLSQSSFLSVHPATASPLTRKIMLSLSSDQGNVEEEEGLLAKAARLRQEAKDLETTLRASTISVGGAPK